MTVNSRMKTILHHFDYANKLYEAVKQRYLVKIECISIDPILIAGTYLQGDGEHCPPDEKFCMVLPPNRVINLEIYIGK